MRRPVAASPWPPSMASPPDALLCAAWMRIHAEAKRLYVRPAFRGLGLGRALIEWVMAEARAAGYPEIVGDTMPVMRDALALYDRMGFERAGTGPESSRRPPRNLPGAHPDPHQAVAAFLAFAPRGAIQ